MTTIAITNGIVFNPFLLKFEEADIIVKDGLVLHVGDLSEFKVEREFNVKGLYVLPGFIDIHFHIESSFLLPQELAYELLRHGTLTIVADPHEVANVLGLEGVLKLIELSKNIPLTVYFQVPSCVPASEFEDTPHKLGLKEWTRLLELNEVIAVGEVMSYHKLLSGDRELLELMRIAKEKGKIIEGHCPRLKGVELSLYAYLGPTSDHTQMTPELIFERVKRGIFVEIQEKSLTKDVIEVLNTLPIGTYAFVTDDVDPAKLVYEGHLDHIIRKAVSLGLSVEKALYATTLSPANRMHLHDRGALVPGRIADIVVVKDLYSFEVEMVFKNGNLVYSKRDGFTVKAEREYSKNIPSEFFKSVKLSKIDRRKLTIRPPISDGWVKANVIEVLPNTTFTKRVIHSIRVVDDNLLWSEAKLTLIAVFNRYGYHRHALGFAKGSILKRGAVATTYAHDSHNLLVVGANVDDMVLAVNHLVECQGGIVVVDKGRIVAFQSLPFAGIMSVEEASNTARNIALIREALVKLGYNHFDPLKSLTTLTLTVSPELKITPRGLFDVKEGRIISLFVEE